MQTACTKILCIKWYFIKENFQLHRIMAGAKTANYGIFEKKTLPDFAVVMLPIRRCGAVIIIWKKFFVINFNTFFP